ncbi:MAG: PIN domain-containing protein [Anaerolineales bacterium]
MTHKPRVFIDADVLFSGAVAPTQQGASLVVLRMAEITLIDALVSRQVVVEAERNLEEKIPQALPAFRLIVQRSLTVIADPSADEIQPFIGRAHPKDLPILVAALTNHCPWLVTFNVRHYQPGHPDVTILRPGAFILQVRDLLSRL